MNILKTLFLQELADRYDSEKRLVRAMPKMIKTATCKKLQKLIQGHLKETIGHVKKLETVFEAFDTKVKSKKCEVTLGLLKEGDEITADFKGTPAINAALISVAQKAEHYEIASYGCLRAWAEALGNKPAAAVLQEILNEEKAANEALIELAYASSNEEAVGQCSGTDSCSEVKTAKLPKSRGGMRPMNFAKSRPVLL